MNPRIFYIIIIGFFILIIANTCTKDSNSRKNNTKTQTERDWVKNPPRSKVDKKWYEGGTLHSATVSEWKKASYENKLATCADYAATADKNVSMEELHDRAVQMMYCISEATRDLPDNSMQRNNEVAALCAMTLGYIK